MNFDISHLLENWEYQTGQVAVRKFKGKDGAEKIQLRVDLGLLQMNAEGRPDGKRPYGHPSLLEYYQARLAKHRRKHGNDDSFVLSDEDCAKLQQEALQYHHRYICLLQLEDYPAVVADTERNLAVMDFVEEFAESDAASWLLQQIRPQLLMMRARAYASMALEAGDFAAAISILEEEIAQIRSFFHEMERPDLAEQSGEVVSLENWLEDIRQNRPLSRREQLEQALAEALRTENYEKAAQVRDALRKLEK